MAQYPPPTPGQPQYAPQPMPPAQYPPQGSPPPGYAQGTVHLPVPVHVRGQFLPPERRAVLRPGRVERARMPETPVHKHRHPQRGEDEVGTDAEGRDAG